MDIDVKVELAFDWRPHGKGGSGALTTRIGEKVLHVDQGNLFKSTFRQKYADDLCAKCSDFSQFQIREKLNQLAGEESQRNTSRLTQIPSTDDFEGNRKELLAKQPVIIREQAQALLTDPDLFEKVIIDVGLLGVAGECELTATIYLIGTSRLLIQPLAAIIQGPSSSGKSYLIEKTAELFPPEAVIHATQMTPQALFHMRPGSLVHRFVVAGERSRAENDERAEATRALREMLSSGKLVKLMPTKIDGRITTEQIEQEGPIAYVESTTLSKVFDEDSNRCILLQTDERENQTRRILRTLAEGRSSQERFVGKDKIIEVHHALQRALELAEIHVPYAGVLAEHFPTRRVEARRAFKHVISTVEAIVLLHQFQRERDADGRLVATIDDYALARRLLNGPMARLLGRRVSAAAHRLYSTIIKHFDYRRDFTTHDVLKDAGFCQSAVRGWLSELCDAGAIEIVEASRGHKPTVWRTGEMLLEDAFGELPEVRIIAENTGSGVVATPNPLLEKDFSRHTTPQTLLGG
jgi:hypothetical protein